MVHDKSLLVITLNTFTLVCLRDIELETTSVESTQQDEATVNKRWSVSKAGYDTQNMKPKPH